MATTSRKSRPAAVAPKKKKAPKDKKPPRKSLVQALTDIRKRAEAEGIVLNDGTLFADERQP